MSRWEDAGGRWKSKAHTGPQGRAGEGKDQQTWNISDLSKYSAYGIKKKNNIYFVDTFFFFERCVMFQLFGALRLDAINHSGVPNIWNLKKF